jgi:hypothetical protein
MGTMTPSEFFKAIDEGMAEVSAKLASGELDGSGRYWTDEELATGIADEGKLNPIPVKTAPES